ncbi:MAG: ABC transporter ATP-binding protein, partial [Methyloligellaceae bacterium]
MLTVENLTLFGRLSVSFELAPGNCLAVAGPSGSGKTVLLRALADLDPAPGNIFLNGRERHAYSGPEWRSHIRYLAAEPGWWEETTRQHMAATDVSNSALEELSLAPALLDRPIRELSTGERQRLALLRGLSDDPDVLLLDEPTSALDPDARAGVEALILRALSRDKGVILVSHDDA